MSQKATCPKVVRIGVQDFEIIELDPKLDPILTEGNYGYTQDPRNIIVIDRTMHESKKRVTVWHEVMHAARFVFENERPKNKTEYEDWEHHFISVWENSLLMIMKDNPKLLLWLLEK
jgi:hypothetical protein